MKNSGYVESVWCVGCGSEFTRASHEEWKKHCLSCYVEAKIEEKRKNYKGPLIVRGKTITGKYFKGACDCPTPPWEPCPHSFGGSA